MRPFHAGAIRLSGMATLCCLAAAMASTVHAQTAGPTVTYPGQTTIPANVYVTFQAPPSDPAGPLKLIVLNQSDQSHPAVQATYDGETLTLAAPAGYTMAPPSDCQAALGTATCHVAPMLDPVRIVNFTILAPGEQPPGPRCSVVSFPLEAGWNIIAGSPNLHGVDSPFYTLENNQYVQVPSDRLELGKGYLIYLDQATTVTAEYLGGEGQSCSFPAQLQGGPPVPCQWVMVGNPHAGRIDVQPPVNVVYPEYAPPWLHNSGNIYGLGVGQGRFAWNPC